MDAPSLYPIITLPQSFTGPSVSPDPSTMCRFRPINVRSLPTRVMFISNVSRTNMRASKSAASCDSPPPTGRNMAITAMLANSNVMISIAMHIKRIRGDWRISSLIIDRRAFFVSNSESSPPPFALMNGCRSSGPPSTAACRCRTLIVVVRDDVYFGVNREHVLYFCYSLLLKALRTRC